MKKLSAFLITAAILLTFAACSNTDDSDTVQNIDGTPAPILETVVSDLDDSETVEVGDERIGTTVKFGGYDWLVLDVQGDRMLIISVNILETRAYHAAGDSVTWEDSDIRAYLNGGFYDSFSESNKAKIAEVTNKTPDNHWFGTAGGADTGDRIFLLSLDEVVKYFGDSGQLDNRPSGATTIDDEYSAARTAYNTRGMPWWWWLRTPGSFESDAVGVDGGEDVEGIISVSGSYVSVDYGGVRPALWVVL
ncbi:MAG: DUF6273 domain-containing protein [Oscillospiraceae bacterium]|nr:DUF6273 domain-containing protein [Oscillospiraceae bacterium]